jgi:hypothetical protein
MLTRSRHVNDLGSALELIVDAMSDLNMQKDRQKHTTGGIR